MALADYCHFTSPIRRYPDLAIHRILSSYLAGKSSQQLWERYETFVKKSAELSSLCEVRAQTAERDCEACYKAEYMRGFLGDVFPGTIVSATAFGLYVELENTVTGLVRLEALPDPELRYDEIASLVDRHGRSPYGSRPVRYQPEKSISACRRILPRGLYKSGISCPYSA